MLPMLLPLLLLFALVVAVIDGILRGLLAGLRVASPVLDFNEWSTYLTLSLGGAGISGLLISVWAEDALARPNILSSVLIQLSLFVMRVTFVLTYPLPYLVGLLPGLLVLPVRILSGRQS